MSTSTTTTNSTESSGEASTQSQPQSQSTQADLFNTTYEYSTEGNLPEDIQRDFEIPISSDLYTLSMPVETILENIKPGWERAIEVLDAGDKDPVWEGSLEPDVLDPVLRHIPKSIEEAKIAVTEDGWYCRVVDPANVCMHEFWIDQSDFESYNLTSKGVIAISLNELKSSYKSSSKTPTINIKIDEERTYTVDDGTPITRSLIDPDSVRRHPDIPDLDLCNEISLPGEELQILFKRLTSLGEHVLIESDEDAQETIFSVETSTDSLHKTYGDSKDLQSATAENQAAFEMNVGKSGETLLSGDYIKDYLTSIRKKDLNDSYTIVSGHEFPIKLRTEFNDKSYSMFMLAPRIQA